MTKQAQRYRVAMAGMAACLLLAMPASYSYAAGGTLDTAFDVDGKVTTDFAGFVDEANAVAVQADGKILAAGLSRTATGDTDFGLARYLSTGGLDTSFSGDGKLTTNFFSGADEARAIVVQPDGNILVAGFVIGSSGSIDFGLARYLPNGSLDTTFGSSGKVTTNFFSGRDGVYAIALQPDGKIVVAGTAGIGTIGDFALARYTTNGSLDTLFGTAGKVTTDFSGGLDEARGLVIQADNKIVVAGIASNGLDTDFALARYNENGSLDLTFDNDGKVVTDVGGADEAYALALQQDGRLVAAGLAGPSGASDFALARYNTDGSLDISFDADGMLTTDFFGSPDAAYSVKIQSDYKIITAGLARDSIARADFGLARYLADGSLDIDFGVNGKVMTNFFSSDEARAVALQSDGRIVAAGYSSNSSFSRDFALARYNSGIAGALQFSAANYSVDESGASATITVTRTGGSEGAISVDYSTSDGTAIADSDYTPSIGTLSFADADLTPQTFTVPITDDAVIEINEAVNLTLSNPTGGAVVGTPDAAVLTIVDNDSVPPPPPEITVAIDIKPGDDDDRHENKPAKINLDSHGKIKVALLSSATFDATTADITTVRFADAAPIKHEKIKRVNKDRLKDVVFTFSKQDLNLAPGATTACLTGTTTAGQAFKGCGAVRLGKDKDKGRDRD
ncbi:MAG: Calx-beta domain-containing protein [Gammaproteobacteria bacterium]|nr:Calx-beta domain-containing protein [Gammaproteobacteria bacterium]